MIFDGPILILAVIGLGCMLGAIAIIANGRLRQGFDFSPIAATSVAAPIIGREEARFVTSFFPSLFISLFSLCWISAARFYQTTQPFAGMFEPSPATENILLEYNGSFAPFAIIKAVSKSHWRVAWFTFLSVAGSAAPIPAGSMFIETPTSSGIRITILATSFYASVAIAFIYCVSLILVRPPEKYRLPRSVFNLADLLSYCYDSRIVDDEEFSVQESTDEHIHLESKVYLKKGLYQFGMNKGKDGRRHLGFDLANRESGSGFAEQIDKFDPGRTIHWAGDLQLWFRRPRLMKEE